MSATTLWADCATDFPLLSNIHSILLLITVKFLLRIRNDLVLQYIYSFGQSIKRFFRFFFVVVALSSWSSSSSCVSSCVLSRCLCRRADWQRLFFFYWSSSFSLLCSIFSKPIFLGFNLKSLDWYGLGRP
jgi:hypothetical protein